MQNIYHGVQGEPRKKMGLLNAFLSKKHAPNIDVQHLVRTKALVETCTNPGTVFVMLWGKKDGSWRAGTGRAGVRARAAAHTGRAGAHLGLGLSPPSLHSGHLRRAGGQLERSSGAQRRRRSRAGRAAAKGDSGVKREWCAERQSSPTAEEECATCNKRTARPARKGRRRRERRPALHPTCRVSRACSRPGTKGRIPRRGDGPPMRTAG